VGEDTYEAQARVLAGEEREQVWAALTRRYPFFAEHAARTPRTIPVIALARA
jgi:F420H(2)-dependent quinone reductase